MGTKLGRPLEYGERVKTNVVLTADLLERVGAEADRRDISRNRFLTMLIERGLPEFEEREI